MSLIHGKDSADRAKTTSAILFDDTDEEGFRSLSVQSIIEVAPFIVKEICDLQLIDRAMVIAGRWSHCHAV